MYMQANHFVILYTFYCISVHAVPVTFVSPVDEGKYWFSSYFGPRKKPNGQSSFHKGIDMAALKGTPVKAAASGLVEEAYEDKGYGKTIVIAHEKKHKTRYAHLDKILVTKGQRVEQGELIGKVGATGNVRTVGKDPSHLHFEVYVGNERVNPLQYLKKDKQ